MHSFLRGFESDRQNRDRDGRGLAFKFDFRAGWRAGGDLNVSGPLLFFGVLGTSLRPSGSAVVRATGGAVAMGVAIGRSTGAWVDHSVDGGADAIESDRPRRALEQGIDRGVEDEVE